MIFTRTPSGLKNFGRFFGANLTVYVEGRIECDEAIEDANRADTKFYLALCSLYFAGKKVKVKLTGNKKNALNYHQKILEQNIPDSLVIVDRDYDGLFFYRFKSPRLILTCGYSWENDFWTDRLILNTIRIATAVDQLDIDSDVLRRLSRRLGKLSAINAVAHCDGKSLFEAKGNSKGINIAPSAYFPLSKDEFSRLARKVKKIIFCEAMKRAYEEASCLSCEKIIQGHLWEHASLLVISDFYAKSTAISLKNNKIFVNIALSSFSENPADFLTEDTLEYYREEFGRVI